MIAAFAEATGDTVSSEIGQWISGRAYLITTFKPVPAGENGGVSVGGTIAGALASTLVVALAFAMGLCGRGGAAIALAAAVAGNLLDSVLGATHRTARPGDQRHREFCRHQLCRRAGACHRAAHRVLPAGLNESAGAMTDVQRRPSEGVADRPDATNNIPSPSSRLPPMNETGECGATFRGIPVAAIPAPLDLIYLDDECRVIHTVESFPTFQVSALSPQPNSVLALPAHSIYSSQTQPGDQLVLCVAEEMGGNNCSG